MGFLMATRRMKITVESLQKVGEKGGELA